jgi:cysteine desulfurase / selenocysteine lyase
MDYRREFADFEDVAFLDVAEQGPLPLVSARAAQAAIEWKKLPHQIPHGIYFDLPDRVRAAVARLIAARPEDVALTTGATGGFSAVAAGLDWKAGDEILVGQGEFPAHFSAWLDLERAGIVRVKVVTPRERFITVEDYVREITPRTRLVSVSLVRFDNAARLDAPRLAHACHQAGAALLLDASQCAGAMPMDVRELGADFIVSAGYKWLLSPYGTGFFWITPAWQERLRLGPLYWMALEGARNFHDLALEKLQTVPGARRWDSPETASFFNLAAMDTSLDFLLRAGAQTIFAHNAELIQQLLDRLPRDCCVLASPAEQERRGPFVCIAARTTEKTRALFEKLRAAQIIVSFRQNALRIAPHLYNTPRDIAHLASALAV